MVIERMCESRSQFVADQVHSKKIISAHAPTRDAAMPCPRARFSPFAPPLFLAVLGETPLQDYAIGGPYTMAFTAETIDVQGVARHVLTNVGLLQAVLYAGQEEILQISMVTQVSQDADGVLVRSIFNPLE